MQGKLPRELNHWTGTLHSLPHVLIHFCRAPVQRRAKSHSHPFGKQTNKNPHKPRKKTISQNENKIIKATEKKWCSLCLSLLYMRPLRAMHFDSNKRYFFFKNETFIMIRYCTVRGASCHQQLKTKVNISSYPWKPSGETTSKSCEITSFWKSYHLPSTSNFFGASSPFVCGNVIRLLSK